MMSTVVKRYIPLAIVSFLGTLMVVNHFFNITFIANIARDMQNWATIIASIALGIASYNLVRQHFSRVLKGDIYSFALIVSLITLPLLYFVTGSITSSQYTWVYNTFIGYLYPAMYAIVGLAIASGCYRSFRVRNIESFLVLITAIILLLGKVPIGAAFTPAANWLLDVVNTGGYRGIVLGIGIGIFTYSLRIIIGAERTWMSQLKEEE